jgi:hypothetical protein
VVALKMKLNDLNIFSFQKFNFVLTFMFVIIWQSVQTTCNGGGGINILGNVMKETCTVSIAREPNHRTTLF